MHLSHSPFRADRTLMIQGTTSDAGKSALVTALCRILARRGCRVAPFKPQTMALNSAVTADGGEIGRAQAVQALAAGVAARVDFNPVLLKPESDQGSQVIVGGRAVGRMKAVQYYDYKPQLLEAVVAAHARLNADFDRVVVEGAGSAAEINLRAHDLANMGFAEAIDCPVVLVADIDRGGVFAHLVGTLEVLSDSERARIQGFVINRFRGDVALLKPGLDWLEARTGKPVLAVVPFLPDLHLEAEDSLSMADDRVGKSQALEVAVIHLPHISNHTDFDPLRLHPAVNLRFVRTPAELARADLIVLPGSKSVRADLDWLRYQRWAPVIERHLRYGGRLLGVCGGYQMLGESIHDPQGVEGEPGESRGLGWLDLATTLKADKKLYRVTGHCRVGERRARVTGYEIHVGESLGAGLQSGVFALDDGRLDGAFSKDGAIMGTYLHGLFDHEEALAALLEWAGLEAPAPFDYQAHRLAEIERLADHVEAAIDWDRWPA